MTQKNQISDGQLAPSESSWWLRELLAVSESAEEKGNAVIQKRRAVINVFICWSPCMRPLINGI
jgi:hypothetical protein